MTTAGFTVTHASDAAYTCGLRSFFEYRDLGINRVTAGFKHHFVKPVDPAKLVALLAGMGR